MDHAEYQAWIDNWVPPKLRPKKDKGEKVHHAQYILYHIQEKLTPYMAEYKGDRILFAWPNLAGFKPFSITNDPWPSFRRPYLIRVTGDHNSDRIEAVLKYWRRFYVRKGFRLITPEEHIATLTLSDTVYVANKVLEAD